MTIRQDLHIRQGESWEHAYTHRNDQGAAVDVSGYSARMSVRRSYEGGLKAYLSSGSDANGGTISLGADGKVTLSMTAKETADLEGALDHILFAPPVRRAERFVHLIYDLELVAPDDTVDRALEGRVIVQREVTS